MNNTIEMMNLYNKTFPNLQTDEETFAEQLMIENGSYIFEHREDGHLVGFSVVNDDGILLLCVDEKYRNQGIGTDLLKRSEAHIFKNFSEIQLGTSRNTYLLCGVPMNDFTDSHLFFIKHGYKEDWISFDMIIDLRKYNPISTFDPNEDGITLRKRRNDLEEIEAIVKCGDMIDGWGEEYRKASDLIVAEVDGKIIGAVIVDPDICMFSESLKGAGSFGCLGVLQEYRKCGVGMRLYQEALRVLKDHGCLTCHIGYTYLDCWYGKLGAVKYTNYWKGTKTK